MLWLLYVSNNIHYVPIIIIIIILLYNFIIIMSLRTLKPFLISYLSNSDIRVNIFYYVYVRHLWIQ